jgi:hypothetical protein
LWAYNSFIAANNRKHQMTTQDLAAKKLAELKKQYVTLQDHMALRALMGARSSESINRVMQRRAMQLAMAA